MGATTSWQIIQSACMHHSVTFSSSFSLCRLLTRPVFRWHLNGGAVSGYNSLIIVRRLFHRIPHSFVIAKFMPKHSASWTSYIRLKKATSWTTRCFLALRISRTDIGLYINRCQGQLLFVVSPRKPSRVNEGCYFAMGSSLDQGTKLLHVEPPLHPEFE
ncbi:hypothetical protein EDB19DRAFT_880411 [Suillus lakei]|nr:hypothetical protein EDB19DRAFT_880411 [Suillus lakei]